MGGCPRALLLVLYFAFFCQGLGERGPFNAGRYPTLTFCVPEGQEKSKARPFGSKLQFVQQWWNGDFSNHDDLSGLQHTFFFGWNPRVGFSSCESLGAEVDLPKYSKGSLEIGGYFQLGKLQLTLKTTASKKNVVGVVSELDIKDMIRTCYSDGLKSGGTRELFSLFANGDGNFDDVLRRRQDKGGAKLIALPIPLDANNKFSLYFKRKRSGSLLQLFSRGNAVRPLLWPLLLSKLRSVHMSATGNVGFAAHKFTLEMFPTGVKGNAAFLDTHGSQNSGVITDVLYGSNIFVHFNVTFLVTPGRSRAFGRDFPGVKAKIIHDITSTLLQSRVLDLDSDGGFGDNGKCTWKKQGVLRILEGFHSDTICPKDAYMDRVGKYHVIDEAPLRDFQKKNPSIVLNALFWRKVDADDSANVWSRRNCAPLCHAIVNYTGTKKETRKMSLRETYRFLALWHRFVDFPSEFISDSIYFSENIAIKSDALVFAAGSHHAIPIGVQVSRQASSVSWENGSNSTGRNVVFSDAPSHLNQELFLRKWQLVSFSPQECIYSITPSVATLDLMVSSSLMAALLAWIVVLLTLWLLLGEVAVHLTSQHGITLPPFVQIVQAPIHLHLVYFNLASTEQMFENWRSNRSRRRSGVVERVVPSQ